MQPSISSSVTDSKPSFRFAFNGKEKDDEIKGNGNSVDFGARIYDSRLGRWMSCDPEAGKTPYVSPYNFVENKPIIAVDPDGKKIVIVSTNPEFRAKAFADLQKLTSTELVLLRGGQVIEAHKLANFPKAYAEAKIEIKGEVTKTFGKDGKKISKTTGTESMLKSIQEENTATIREVGVGLGLNGKPAPKSNQTQFNGKAGSDPKSGGTDPTIFYDPNSCGDKIMNADGTSGRYPQSGLAHELFGHGLDAMTGTDNTQLVPNVGDPDNNGVKGHLDIGEIKVRSTVDQTGRTEQGDTERAMPK